jgi:hypothetical protein
MKAANTIKLLAGFLLLGFSLQAQDLSGVRILINPGHGGYDSDDRNVVIAPFTSGNQNGFWESKSNLDKGLALRSMLLAHNAQAMMSRTQNTTADDLPLSAIVQMANEYNADFMLSIHSNAGAGSANHVLMLYSGVDTGDTYIYPTPTPYSELSKAISTEIAKNIYSNQITTWSSTYSVRGDKTFGRVAMGGWSDGYGVLRGLTVPGVISEASMHDYIPETYRLMNMDYKRLEAWHFLKSFATYFKSAALTTGNIAGSVRDKFLLNEANYFKLPASKDIYLPVNGATVKILPGDSVCTTDNLNNGVFSFENLPAGTYSLVTQAVGYHPDTTQLTVEANKTTYANIRLNKIRNTPPQVVEYSPRALTPDTVMLASSVIRLKFNWDIDPASAQQAFSITPAVAGTFVFKESNFVMEFVPSAPLDVSTIYTVTLAKTLKHFDGLTMENDFTFQFKTASRNQLKLIAAYPMKNETNVDYLQPVFTFVFDKKLQTSELINGVQVYDKSGKLIAKNLRKLYHNTVPAPYGSTQLTMAENLVPGGNYIVKLAKGIKDVDGVFLTDTLEIPFTASNERVTDKTVAENFETAGKLSVDELQSKLVGAASVLSSSSTRLFDTYSYNLKYTFTDKTGGEVVYRFNSPSVNVTCDSVMGLHIYGDLSGNELYLMFLSGGETKLIRADSIHYGFWKYAEVSLKELPAQSNWQFTGFKILQTTAPLSATGNLLVDNLLIYSKPLSVVSSPKLNNVKIYPNPASDVLFVEVKDNQPVQRLELYSISGQLIRKSTLRTMQVADIIPGTYMIKVRMKEGTITVPVFISR